MAEIILDQAQVAPGMGQSMSAGMSQHVRMDTVEPCPRRNDRHEIVDGLPRYRLTALGQEQPRQTVLSSDQKAPDRAQLIACQWLAGGETTLQPMNPKMSCFQIKITAAQRNQFAHPQAMPIDEEQHGMIARAVPPGPGRDQQPPHLIRRQVIARALMGIDGRDPVTLDKTPVGARLRHAVSPLPLLTPSSSTLDETLIL